MIDDQLINSIISIGNNILPEDFITTESKKHKLSFETLIRNRFEKIILLRKDLNLIVPKLEQRLAAYEIMKSHTAKTPIIKWISSFLLNHNFIKIDQKVIHSIPQNLEIIASIINNIMVLNAFNNKSCLVYGSFASYLYNKNINYSDIDLAIVNDNILKVAVGLGFLYTGIECIIVSIPFIINHRQIRMITENEDGTKSYVSLCDTIIVNDIILDNLDIYPVKIAKGIFINTLDVCIQFFNYFKMIP